MLQLFRLFRLSVSFSRECFFCIECRFCRRGSLCHLHGSDRLRVSAATTRLVFAPLVVPAAAASAVRRMGVRMIVYTGPTPSSSRQSHLPPSMQSPISLAPAPARCGTLFVRFGRACLPAAEPIEQMSWVASVTAQDTHQPETLHTAATHGTGEREVRAAGATGRRVDGGSGRSRAAQGCVGSGRKMLLLLQLQLLLLVRLHRLDIVRVLLAVSSFPFSAANGTERRDAVQILILGETGQQMTSGGGEGGRRRSRRAGR